MSDKLEGPGLQILEQANYAVLSVPRKDGTIQSVVVWAHAQDGEVTVNGAEGRAWPANLRRAKTATVTAMRDGDPRQYVAVTGSLVGEVGEPQASAHIDMLSKKYMGVDEYGFREAGEQRVFFRLRPEHVLYVDVRDDAVD